MGPTLGPPVDRYARRREAGKEFANAISGFFQKQSENESERIENEALEKQGLSLQGLRGKARDQAIKSFYEGELKEKEIGSRLRAEKGFSDYKRAQEEAGEEELIREASDETEEKPFNRKSPSSWTNAQIEKLRSIPAKTAKAKSLVQRAQQEYERRENHKKIREKMAPVLGALEIVNEMKELGKKGNLGWGTSAYQIFSPEARKDAAEYEQKGKSLISVASTIPIRSQAEFETLSQNLFDPTISDAGREGILNAIERILQNSLKAYSELEPEDSRKEIAQQRPPLTSFMME